MLLSGSLWMASRASRRMRSASARERETWRLFRTRSTGSLESLYFTRICLQRTCFTGSARGRLPAGPGEARAESTPHSRKAQSAVRLPDAPRTCASCSSAPEATRGRPKCLLRSSAMSSCVTAVAISLHASKMNKCFSCNATMLTSGVAMTNGGELPPASSAAPAGPQPALKTRSPKARVTCNRSLLASLRPERNAWRPCGPSCTMLPPPSQMRRNSEGVAKECTGVLLVTCSRPSSASSPRRPIASPTLAMKSLWPVRSAMTALQPSPALPGRAKNSASTSSQLARSAPAI
mmetsp:Transcript_62039/g.144367  ORF Transcript_62039/g.144367 Transcript_62039/m.144367 type:complete len:292 (-) Transcript_62039:196-1071(-)